MAVYDTDENKRSSLTEQTLLNLIEQNDFTHHRIFISDNGSCEATRKFYTHFQEAFGKYFPKENLTIHLNGKNLGTASAINIGWRTRKSTEYAIKMDNDVVVHYEGWIDLMEEAMLRQPKLGILGLKRGDLEEHPNNGNPEWRTTLVMLPHNRGEKWIVVEQCKGVFGTVQMYSPTLLTKIGYLVQPTKYGFDDILAGLRCNLANLAQAYLPGVHIEHIDRERTDYWSEKEKSAGRDMPAFNKMKEDLMSGKMPIYYEPKWETYDIG
jgi:GT2 family glycosyltransferase